MYAISHFNSQGFFTLNDEYVLDLGVLFLQDLIWKVRSFRTVAHG